MGCPSVSVARTRTLLILLLGFWVPVPAGAQTAPPEDTSVTVDTIEGPREGSAVHPFAVGNGTAWLLSKRELFKVDTKENRLASVSVEEIKRYGFGLPSMVAAAGSIWVFGEAHKVGGIHRIDPETGKCVATIALEKRKGENSLAFGQGSLWVLNQADGVLVRIDPNTNQVTATINVGKAFWAPVVVGDDAIWVMGLESGAIKRVDPRLNEVVDEFSVGPAQKNGILAMPFKGGMYSLSFGEGSLWVSDWKQSSGQSVLFRIDPKSHERLATIEAANLPAFWNGFAWVSSMGHHLTGHFIDKIDPKTNQLVGRVFLRVERGRTVFSDRGSMPAMLLADNDALWAISEGSSSFSSLLIRRIHRK